MLVEPTAAANAAAVGFWFPSGSRTERADQRGYTHFCEHMAFKGTERRGAFEIARSVDRVGGYLNAFTERDVVCLHCTVPSESWRFAVEILSDLCFNATFPEDEFEREKTVVVNEILSALDDPEECANDAFLAGIWKGDPIAAKIAGERKDVERYDRDALLGYFREVFDPARLVVSFSGPASADEVANELLKWVPPPRRSLREAALATPAHTPLARVEKARIGQVYLFSGGPVDPPFASDDFYTLSVLNNAYGESMSSRLFQELRERRGLCYTVYSSFAITPTAGLWMVYAATVPEDFAELVEGLEAERSRLQREGLTDAEIADSVSHIAGTFGMALDDVESRMKRIARQYLFSSYALDPEETLQSIRSVTRAKVDAMIPRILASSDFLAYGKVGPREERLLAVSAGTRR